MKTLNDAIEVDSFILGVGDSKNNEIFYFLLIFENIILLY